MATQSKFFRVATEGATTDGRNIERRQIEEMAASFNPQTYGARIWLEHLRSLLPDGPFKAYGDVLAVKCEEVAPDHPGKVVIGSGEGADYANLDATVMDAINLLDPWYQEDTDLVAIIGRKLLNDKYFPLVNTQQAPTETLAADIILSQKRIGGLPAVRVPSFPDNAVLVTCLDNLSIYYQEGARRRRLEDAAKRDRIENYESSNDAHVIEDNGLAALVENIQFQPAGA